MYSYYFVLQVLLLVVYVDVKDGDKLSQATQQRLYVVYIYTISCCLDNMYGRWITCMVHVIAIADDCMMYVALAVRL